MSHSEDTVRAAILGFGTVGQGIYRIADEKREELRRRLGGKTLVIVKVLVHQLHRANRVLPDGMNPALLTDSIADVFASDVQVVFEATVGEQPAYDYLATAIKAHHCSVITANKVMFAKYATELFALAEEAEKAEAAQGSGRVVQVGYEATVAGGLPVIKTLQNMCLVQRVTKVEGILNGTTNFILTSMREHPGETFKDSLAEAQRLGYAETDPYNDVSGQDAFKKLMVLSTLVFGRQPAWESVEVVGIDTITPEDVAAATSRGQRYRHVASLAQVTEKGEAGGASIVASVRPQLVSADSPLYTIDAANNAVAVETDYCGTVTITGAGAGMYPTASVMVEDYAVMMLMQLEGKRLRGNV